MSHFRTRADADGWLASPQRARLVAEAGLHSAGELQTRYVSGLERWLAAPGAPVLVPPAQWKTALISAAGILPLLELVSYLLSPRLAALPVWARPLGLHDGLSSHAHQVRGALLVADFIDALSPRFR